MSSVRGYCIVAAIIAVVLMILGIASLATPHWVEDTFGSVVGLWEFCSYSSCISFNGSQADYIKAVQAFHIIGILTLAATILHALIGVWKAEKKFLRSAAILLSLTGLFFTVSMSVFTNYYYAYVVYYYGYSYILGWVVVVGGYIAGVGFEYASKRNL